MRFGTRDAFKSVVAARAAAAVAWAARDGGDRVGGVVLGAAPLDHSAIAPQRSRTRLLRFLATLSDATSHQCVGAGNEHPPPSLGDALSLLARTSRPGTLLHVISDFADLDGGPGAAEAALQLERLARRCEVACILVYDQLETEAPRAGAYRVSDGTRVLELPSGSRRWRERYAARFATRRERLTRLCRESGMAFFALATGDDCRTVLRAARGGRVLRAPCGTAGAGGAR
jgi:uncharacterized protein (DUF58 family)